MPLNPDTLKLQFESVVNNWFQELGESRNNCVAALKVLDGLIENDCPIDRATLISRGKGELAGVRGVALAELLKKYGESREFTKGATARQTLPNAQRLLENLEDGKSLAGLSKQQRSKILAPAVQGVMGRIANWYRRQNIKVAFAPDASPTAWFESIFHEAENRTGPVAQHLVEAKLQERLKVSVPCHPATAGDYQTGRKGDIEVDKTVFHVTMAVGSEVVQKCATNIASGLLPILIVPRSQTEAARTLAKNAGIETKIAILAIEDFLAQNLLEMAGCEKEKLREKLDAILAEYNKRVENFELDKSLRIERK
jgi:hypothetical protein